MIETAWRMLAFSLIVGVFHMLLNRSVNLLRGLLLWNRTIGTKYNLRMSHLIQRLQNIMLL